ncbi:MAG: beta-propeller fold lactonase family protein [Opitutaceae bacterium]
MSLLALVSTLQAAAPPGVMNHQGRIAVNGVNHDGSGYFKIAFVDGAGTATYWSNDATSVGGAEPTTAVEVTVTQGHYAIPMGDTSFHTNMTGSIPTAVFSDNTDVRVRIWFSTSIGGPYELLSPDRRVTSTGYALSAAQAESVTSGAVSGLDDPDGYVSDAVNVSSGGLVSIGTDDPLDGLEPMIVPRGTNGTGLAGPQSVAVQGDYVYVVDLSTDVLAIFDISDPDNIVPKDIDGTGLTFPRSVAVQGNYAYVIDSFTNLLSIFDVSDPNNIIPKDSDSTGLSGPLSVAVQGNYVYVANTGNSELCIFDVSNPDSIVAKDTDGTGLVAPNAVAVQGNYAYVIDNNSDVLAIFDVSNPDTIVAKDSDNTGLSNPVSVALQGNYAYVIDSVTDLLTIFDISDPNAIVAKDSDNTGVTFPQSVAVQGSFAYVVDNGNDVLAIFDISDPNSIVAKDTDGTGLINPGPIAVQGNFAYVIDATTDLLSVFEVAPALTVDGALRLTGSLYDSSSLTGSSGQILSSTGAGTGWTDLLDNDDSNELNSTLNLSGTSLELTDSGGTLSQDLSSILDWSNLSNVPAGFGDDVDDIDDADADPANELQSLSLTLNSLSISNGNVVDLGIYLRSETSDSYSNGTMTFNPGSTLVVNGQLEVGTGNINDDDYIYFDGSTLKYLKWDETNNRFDFSNSLAVSNDLIVGSLNDTFDDFIYFDDGINEFLQWDESEGGFVISNNLGIGTDLFNDDDYLYFDSGTAEYLAWKDSSAKFEISDDLVVDGSLSVGILNSSNDDYIYFDDGSEYLFWDNTHGGFIFSNSLGIGTVVANDDDYLYFDSGASEHLAWIEADNRFEFSDEVALTGNLYVGTANGTTNDSIYFDEGTTEYLRWHESNNRFEISDSFVIDGSLNVGTLNGSNDDYINFDDGSEYLSWNESNGRFEFSDEVAATVFTPTSDRNAKENFQSIDAQEILEKLIELPLSKWQFIKDDGGTRHIGPVAQDFYATFNVGSDNRHISTTDADGVALAAIQGLNQKLEEENTELRDRIQRLETLVQSLLDQNQ